MKLKRGLMTAVRVLVCVVSSLLAWSVLAHESWKPERLDPAVAHAPSPLPDRVVLTWESDPATTQSVTWRTDTSVKQAQAQIAVANANGRAMEPVTITGETVLFSSDINDANYHTASFVGLEPATLYAYRVGDGANWTEYYHFRTASEKADPFSFIYFGDAQNDIRTHWSRVFREAFRDAPRAAFTLHAGDLINKEDRDAEWGEWHQATDWVNGTIPVIAVPGNHEYRRINQGPESERFWNTKTGDKIEVEVTSFTEVSSDTGTLYSIEARGADGTRATLQLDDGGVISVADVGVSELSGFTRDELLGTSYYRLPLRDRQRDSGDPAVSPQWRPQFAFPVQGVANKALWETVYVTDYQGTRFIALNSNEDTQSQVAFLRRALEDNPNRWTVVTFHHPVFSPATDRDNPELRALWKPLLDEFKVDLVLNGHDHTYARTGVVDTSRLTNVPEGYQHAYDPAIGTVYVVSVSGPKMYAITKGDYARRTAENTQLYQVIDIDGDRLRYRAFTATGVLYDEFALEKTQDGPNRLIEASVPD